MYRIVTINKNSLCLFGRSISKYELSVLNIVLLTKNIYVSTWRYQAFTRNKSQLEIYNFKVFIESYVCFERIRMENI